VRIQNDPLLVFMGRDHVGVSQGCSWSVSSSNKEVIQGDEISDKGILSS
jgi:hypothetical protein